MADELKGLKVAVLATDGFEQSELEQPRAALDEAGAQTKVVSLKPGEIKGWQHTDWGTPVRVDAAIDQVEATEFDALLLPGGVMSPDRLRMDAPAVAFVQEMVMAGKPVAAICHGPWTLINARAVAGVRMTSWPSLRDDLINAGADWVDEECVVDGNIVTSRKPDDIPAFNKAMIELFANAAVRGEPAI